MYQASGQQRRLHTEQPPNCFAPGNYRMEEEYDLNQLPDNEEDQYEFDEEANNHAPPDDGEENIDFNNYKGIYADDDAGQKF